MKRIRINYLSLFIFIIILLFFCNSCKKETVTPKTLQKVRIGLSKGGEINSLNPAIANTASSIIVIWHLYDRLVDIDEANGSIKPMLAISWQHNDELTEWIFNLRNNVYFKKNTENIRLDANDAKSSIEYALSKPSFARSLLSDLLEGAQEFIDGKVANISGLIVEGDILKFKLKRPFSFLPERLATSFFSIMPRKYLSEIDQGRVVGSGPYTLQEWKVAENYLLLKKNSDYWDKNRIPAPDLLEIRYVQNEGTLISEFKAGNLDWIEISSDIGQELPKDAVKKEYLTLNNILIAFNFENKEIKKLKALRKVMDLSINREDLKILIPGCEPFRGPFPYAFFPEFVEDPSVRNEKLNLAIKELKNSGFNLKNKIELLVMPGEIYRRVSLFLTDEWKKIDLNVIPIEGQADFFSRIVKGDFQICLAYYGPFIPSAEQYLWIYLSYMKPLPNAARYANEKLDSLYNDLTRMLSKDSQSSILKKISDTVNEDPPYVSLFTLPNQIWHIAKLRTRFLKNGIPLFIFN